MNIENGQRNHLTNFDNALINIKIGQRYPLNYFGGGFTHSNAMKKV